MDRADLDALPGLVWSADGQGNIDFLNQRWLDYTGMALEQVKGWNWVESDMLHPEDVAGLTASWRSFLESRQAGEVQARLRRHDRVYRWFLFRVTPMLDEHGQVVKWWGLNVDIHDRKLVEATSRRQTEVLTRLGSVGRETLARLAEQPDLERLLSQVLSAYFDYFESDTARIWLGDDRIVHLYLHMDRGDEHPTVEGGYFPRPHSRLSFALNDERLRLRPGQLGIDHEADWETLNYDRQELRAGGIKMVVRVPLYFGQQMRGLLTLRFKQARQFDCEDSVLAHALANQLVLVLELRRWSEQTQVVALSEQRNRLARDMHDTLAQAFTGIIMQLEAAVEAASHQRLEQSQGHVRRAGELARSGLQEARRSVGALRPQALEEHDLPEALRASLENLTLGANLLAEFEVKGHPPVLSAEVEEHLLRLAQEAVTNSVRHAGARSLRVELGFERDRVRLSIEDDGRGFALPVSGGYGLLGMGERARAIGAELSIESERGTRITVSVPWTR